MAWPGRTTAPEPAFPTTPAQPAAPASPTAAAPAPQHAAPAPVRTATATIGKSIQIKGDVSGSEDLTIEGKVVGKILLNGQTVKVSQGAQVMAEIQARFVVVSGEARGDITADGRVEVAPTGLVLGNVRAPRVVLTDGSHFNGTIDMEVGSNRPR